MDYTPVTPFRRTVDAALVKHQQAAQADLPAEGANKWEVLRELGVARVRFGLSHSDLGVLQALLSFHPNVILGGNSDDLIVHPSNAAICERLNGMPCSTMRRHLANLVRSGLLVRRDSPNGKRYVRRSGEARMAYGFNVAPLVLRFAEIRDAAEEIRAEEQAYARLRQSVSLMRRDLAGLVAFGLEERPQAPLWRELASLAAEAARELRRKLAQSDLAALAGCLETALDRARDFLEAEILSTNGAGFEHHYHNSNTDSHDFEPCLEKARVAAAGREMDRQEPDESAASGHADTGITRDPADNAQNKEDPVEEQSLPNVPLGLVLSVCSEFRAFFPDRIRHWHQLVRAAETLRPMMGISPTAWEDAIRVMGPEEAAVVLVAMLERQGEIKSPGGYLRHLTRKSENGAFSCGPMVMALARKDAA